MGVTTASHPLVGEVVDGRYRVLRHLADGGMATVLLATDTRLDREVALKVMRPDLAADQTFVATHQPDILCLQETKVIDEKFPVELLRAAVVQRSNVLIVGGTSSGKTTLARDLSSGGRSCCAAAGEAVRSAFAITGGL